MRRAAVRVGSKTERAAADEIALDGQRLSSGREESLIGEYAHIRQRVKIACKRNGKGMIGRRIQPVMTTKERTSRRYGSRKDSGFAAVGKIAGDDEARIFAAVNIAVVT